jgi:hypothetical protein
VYQSPAGSEKLIEEGVVLVLAELGGSTVPFTASWEDVPFMVAR